MNELIKELIKETLLNETRTFKFHPSWTISDKQSRILKKGRKSDEIFLKRINKLAKNNTKHLGKTIATPTGASIGYVLHNKKYQTATQQHENFHMIMNSIERSYPNIKNAKEKICWFFLSELSQEQIDIMMSLVNGLKKSYNEAIAYLITYVNSSEWREKKGKLLRKLAQEDKDENEFDIDAKIFKIYDDLAEVIKNTPAEVVINAITNRRAGGDGQ